MSRICQTLFLMLSTTLAAVSCSSEEGGSPDAAPVDAEPPPDAAPSPGCVAPPQLMIALDRSGSLARRPDGSLPPNTEKGMQQTRWSIAIEAIELISGALDHKIQFGLALFPRASASVAGVS